MTINSDGPKLRKKSVKKVTRSKKKLLIDEEKEESPVQIIDSRNVDPSEEVKTLFPTLEGRMLVIKVGDDTNMVDDAKLQNIEKDMNSLLEQFGIKCLIFVTNHFVDVSVI